MRKHIEYIICPNCQSIQIAEVEHTIPWWGYTHICNECEYMTMESEWQNVHNIKLWQKIMFTIMKFRKYIC